MSGGRLVVLDRVGRDVKRFPLPEGLATMGSDPACDIRIMLPSVSPHHATVVVHANQTVVRNVSDGETLVNGCCVSVAALRHGDVISIGGRHLRWEYAEPGVRRAQAAEPALHAGRRRARAARRASGPGGAPAREPALQRALEMTHRASMPGGTGGKQVAIVQPQRRDTGEQIDKNPPRTPLQSNKRPRSSRSDLDTSVNETENENAKRKSNARVDTKSALPNLQNTTKATLWIESRKTSPRKSKIQTPMQQVLRMRRTTVSAKKSTPLRLTVLKRAQSAQKLKVTKIEAPLKMDHTKQAAILLMTGHTPKCRLSSPQPGRSPSFGTKLGVARRSSRASPGNCRATAGNSRATPAHSRATLDNSPATPGYSRATPGNSRATPGSSRATPVDKSVADQTVSILEITDSEGRNSSRRSGQKSPKKSPALLSPKKSSLKDPLAKRGTRKIESIKFDLSNLENHSQESDVLMVTDTTQHSYEGDSASDDDITLHYSESSGVQSPSPRRSIHSRSSKILQKSLGTTPNRSSKPPPSRTLTPESPQPRRSLRGSMIMQKALNETETLSYSRRTTKSMSDKSQNETVASAFRTRTLSPRTSRNDLESYSIVDLVSIDTDGSARSTSVYDSAASTDNTAFGTPQTSTGRKTRSTIDPTLVGSSTPYAKTTRLSTPRSRSDPNTSGRTSLNGSHSSIRSSKSRRSKSLSTPENTENAKKHISVNSTRISRASRSRSRINDSDLLLLDDDDDSPKTSKRISTASRSNKTSVQSGSIDINVTPINSPSQNEGTSTPENRHSPEEASTPVLSIQSLLDSSQSSLASQRSTRRGRPSFNAKRKTIGGFTGPKPRVGTKSKSMNLSARKTRLRLSRDSVEVLNNSGGSQDSEIVTPKSAVKLVPEGVKNKHSTAKKPQSKRSIIDDLNESDFVKQLFNSPVKRKLSQSMTEFSRKQLFDDDDLEQVRRPTRNTITMTGQSPENSLLDHTESYTPEIFVSPLSTPRHSPNLDGIKLLFAKSTPENDLRNVRGVKGLLRTPRTRRSIKNDLTNVSGVKNIFAKGPKNSLSDVRVKEVFASSPKNDLSRVSGVKSLFQSTKKRKSPRNDLDDVRGVKKLFKTRSPANDLRNVSGVKRTLRKHSPKNDLSDVRGVRRMFRQEKQRIDLSDVSGVEELFNLSNQSHGDAESLFDQLVGKPQVRAVYSKTFSTKTVRKTRSHKRKSLHASLDAITHNVEGWLEQELKKRLHKETEEAPISRSINKSKGNKSRALQMLVTETVEGNSPIRTSRVRNSTVVQSNDSDIGRKKSASELYSAHTLPIKKRSLAELSLERGGGYSGLALPLKKRGVLHSTPRRGAREPSPGRESPIAAPHRSHQPEEIIEAKPKSRRSTRATTDISNAPEYMEPTPKKTRDKALTEPKFKPVSPTKETAAAPVNVEKPSPVETKAASPTKKASRAKIKAANLAKKASPTNTKVASPARKASSIKTKAANLAKQASPAKTIAASPARKASPAKTKAATLARKTSPAKTKAASPTKIASPAKTKAKTPTKKASPAKTIKHSPVQAKATRSRKKDVSIPESNTKKRGATLIMGKKSPVMSPKPRATRKRKEPETLPTPKPSPKKTRATRKNDENTDDKPKTPKNTRAKVQKTVVIVSKPSPQMKPRATKTRSQEDQSKTDTRQTRKTGIVEDKVESSKKSQVVRKTRATEVQNAPKTRGRKTVANISKETAKVEKPVAKTKKGRQTAEPIEKTRNNKREKSGEDTKTVRSRGKKAESQESVESEPSTRSRRAAKLDVTTEVKTRKRKTTAPDSDIPPKVSKSNSKDAKGKKQTTEAKSDTVHAKKKLVKDGKVENTLVDASVRSTRSKRIIEVEPVKALKAEQKPVRGKKANIENVPVNQETGKRKRASAAEPSPAEQRSKKQRATKKPAGTAASPSARDMRSRNTRGNDDITVAAGKTAGRSRRR